MRIAYGKLGRSIPVTLDDASNVGGDIEVVRLLDELLRLGHEVHLVGRNRAEGNRSHDRLVNHWGPDEIFDNPPPMSRKRDDVFDTYDKFFRTQAHELPKFDAWLIWLGQHGSSLHPVPAVQQGKTGFTNPLMSDVNYGYPLIAMLNELDVQPFWLCPDPRNQIKFRDLWNPKQRTVLAQFNTSKDNTFYDERDGRLRDGGTRYEYSGIELLAAPPLNDELPHAYDDAYAPERSFGLLVNEGYNNLGAKGRLHLVQQWCKDISDYEIFGTWSDPSQVTLGRQIGPVALADVHKTLQRWRATMTFPATGGGWATAKPWECFKAGTVCFKHPGYDTQGHIYSKLHMCDALGEDAGVELINLLCPPTVSGLVSRLKSLEDDATWRRYAGLQYRYFVASHARLQGGVRGVHDAITPKTVSV